MLQTTAIAGRKPALPCPGLVDAAGTVRDTCRACGKCDDIIRDMLRGVARSAVNNQSIQPAMKPA